MTEEAREPLVPAEVDLRGYEFMPYYGDRLRDSDLNSRATDAEYRAAHNLWWSAWKQVPAASLPDDDVILARLADLGRDVKTWRKVRDGALRGFIKCSDGRLYHRILGPLAIEAWQFRNSQRDRTEKARKAALSRRQSQTTTPTQKPSVTESTGQDRTGQDIKRSNTLSGKPDVHKQTAVEILTFLNAKTGRHYKPVKANTDMIVARLKDGATETELRQVIAKKTREWQGDEKMQLYLRPATLFNRTKFAQYQGELLQPEGQDAVS